MTFGKRIRQLRTELGITQEQLAELTGYSGRSTISRIEGDTASVPMQKLPLLAEALHTTTEYLIGLRNSPSHSTIKQHVLDWIAKKTADQSVSGSPWRKMTLPLTRPSKQGHVIVFYLIKDGTADLKSAPLNAEGRASNLSEILRDIRLLYGVKLSDKKELRISGPSEKFPDLLLRLSQAILYFDIKTT